MTATGRSATVRGSRRSPACWTWIAGPAGMRVIVRKERPHPGAQLRFTDIDGHRFTAFATDTRSGQLADLELRHRQPGPVRGPDPLRQGHRAAEPPAEGLRPEPALVRDRRPGLRAAGLGPDARPGRGRPPLGAETAPAAPVRRRRAGSSAAAAACGCASRRTGPGPRRSPPRSPGCRPSRPADQPEQPLRQERRAPGPVEPRPPGATAGQPGTTERWNPAPWPVPQATTSRARKIEARPCLRTVAARHTRNLPVSPVSQSVIRAVTWSYGQIEPDAKSSLHIAEYFLPPVSRSF